MIAAKRVKVVVPSLLLLSSWTALAQDAATATAPAEPAAPAAAEAAAPVEAAAAPAAEAASAGETGAPSDSSGEGGSGWFSDFDVTFGGFIRPEVALKTSDQENANNQRGNPYDSITVARQAYAPPAFGTPSWSTLALPIADTVRRPIAPSNNVFNMHILRAEGELGVTFTHDLKLIARARAVGDFGHYSDFDAGSVGNLYGGISGGDPGLYGGAPNYFQYRVDGDKHPNPLEWAGANYMVYFPTAILDYNHGPLNVRLGNQAIAWGQAIFFRVLDVVDGLDLRRHSVLDYAQEEFADKRVPSPALRIGYQLTDAILADGYVQKFQPTVYGNPNTPYNVIPVQFTVHDRYSQGGFENKLSYGLRLKANFGQWGFQAMAVRRYNPDGVFRWTRSGVNKDLPNVNADGSLNLLATTVNLQNGGHAGTALQDTPFEASPGGVYSANEWFHYASMVRLNGVTGLNASINDFQPATGKVDASPVSTYQDAFNELNTFFIAAGGSLRGHIEREYFQEYNFGGGVSYVTEGEPGSILDQLIINLETTYTPNRVYTAPDLGHDFLHQNDWVGALVLEKYQRFTQAFPATYFVFQYMHRTKDDLFGRSLQGYGGTDTKVAPGVAGGSNYIVFAFQQPLPQDIIRFGFAALYDPRGAVLVQPGVQYHITGKWELDGFYSYINGHLNNPNKTLLGNLDWANEATLRLSYQF
ncbi:MAG: DUF1302 family protein [Nevskia sp.]|nr:DUF1302 family protein [Nevskia sp.]